MNVSQELRGIRRVHMDGLLALFAVVFALASPFWLPFAFLAYAVGHKQFGLRFLFFLITAESVSIGFCVSYLSTLQPDDAISPPRFFLLDLFAMGSPLWIPVLCIAYATGRKKIEPLVWFFFIALEVVCVFIGCGTLRSLLED
jgi:hypothetical protein